MRQLLTHFTRKEGDLPFVVFAKIVVAIADDSPSGVALDRIDRLHSVFQPALPEPTFEVVARRAINGFNRRY